MRSIIRVYAYALIACGMSVYGAAGQTPQWMEYAGNPQHTALSTVAASALNAIRWQTAVDLNPVYSGNDLFIHYGSPLTTAANTIIVPVKTGASGGFRVDGRSGGDGHLLWRQTTDYILPASSWTPSYSPALSSDGRLYYAGAGGTVYYRSALDSDASGGSATPTQLAFFGAGGNAGDLSGYQANQATYNANLKINTPISADRNGNIFFGYQLGSSTPAVAQSGIARIDATGHATFISAATAAGDVNIVQVPTNSAPALSNDGSTLYVAVRDGSSNGYLLALNSTTLQPITGNAATSRVDLIDPKSGSRARLADISTAAPTVGPDGNVYFGVLENPFSSSKGWLLHFKGDLSLPAAGAARQGAFGWDDTASIVPSSIVASYHGTSQYLLMTKYNDYAGLGGTGVNKLAILDPNDTQTDTRTGVTVMKEILTIAGVTPDPEFPNNPGAVREWCINTAAIDPITMSVLANSEDGKLYRWDLTTNTFTQVITLTAGIGEAYTPTLIGPDGAVYAVNNATLFAIGASAIPEPSTCLLVAAGMAGVVGASRLRGRKGWRRRRRSASPLA